MQFFHSYHCDYCTQSSLEYGTKPSSSSPFALTNGWFGFRLQVQLSQNFHNLLAGSVGSASFPWR